MRLRMALFGVFVAAAAMSAQSQSQSQFVGKWDITGTGEYSKYIYFLDVKENNGQLEAKFLDRSAHATPVPWIRVEGNELVWQKGNGSDTLPKPSCGPIYRAKLEGGKLVGSHTEPGEPCPAVNRGGGAGRAAGAGEGRGAAAAAGQNAANQNAAPRANAAPAAPKAAPTPRTINWVGVRQPVFAASNANGNHTYGAPVVIVGKGIGKETWTGLDAPSWQTPNCADRWTVTDGVLKNEVAPNGQPPTCNIYTKDKFKDFKVEADIILEAGQNSGFYLRGRHELQLMLPNPNGRASGPPTYPGQLMDLYGWKAADNPVPNPAGQPQHLEVIVVGNHFTAIFNGKKVHDNAVLYAWTGGALDANEDQPGPIMIQGDHSRVSISKLVVTPITKAGM